MSTQEADDRYFAAMHGVQSAIMWAMTGGDPDFRATEPKHLRVGIDSAHITDRAVATLLIAKGVFTIEEYASAVADAAEAELAEWHKRARQVTGTGMLRFQ